MYVDSIADRSLIASIECVRSRIGPPLKPEVTDLSPATHLDQLDVSLAEMTDRFPSVAC